MDCFANQISTNRTKGNFYNRSFLMAYCRFRKQGKNRKDQGLELAGKSLFQQAG